MPSVLKWILIIMFVIGILIAMLNFPTAGLLTSILVIAYCLAGIAFSWYKGKLTKQSNFSQFIALAFFICSWQLVIPFAYAGTYSMVTLMLTIAFGLLFLVIEGINAKKRAIYKKEEAEKELAKKQARAERKAAKQNASK